MVFPCVQCGLCCRKLKTVSLLTDYDSGNGVCRYLKDNLCSIYHNRPLVCNVEKMYVSCFSGIMSEQEFLIANLEVCLALARDERNAGLQSKLCRCINSYKQRGCYANSA
jgi:Fe-S-cluster containining protein